MNKNVITLLLAAIAVIFVSSSLYAGTTVPDTMKMETPGFTKRKKGPPKFKLVEFTHKKHVEDYKLTCGQCHHDDKGQPLENLKAGDDVKKCSECHNKFTKDKKNKKDIMVLENAMHENCIGCHQDFNKEKTGNAKKGPAPTSCGKCHEKA